MNRDLFINKRQSIRACLERVRLKHAGGRSSLADLDRREIILLNLQRACELSIDLAMHAVASRSAGIPQDSRDAFRLLEQAGVLGADLSRRLQRMVGFRNVAVHQYREIDLDVLGGILDNNLDDFEDFLEALAPLARPHA